MQKEKGSSMDESMTLTVEQAAHRLGISRGLAYLAVHRGELPIIRIGKRLLIPRIALERMLDGMESVKGKAK